MQLSQREIADRCEEHDQRSRERRDEAAEGLLSSLRFIDVAQAVAIAFYVICFLLLLKAVI